MDNGARWWTVACYKRCYCRVGPGVAGTFLCKIRRDHESIGIAVPRRRVHGSPVAVPIGIVLWYGCFLKRLLKRALRVIP